MLTLRDKLQWSAGFLEGEGSFSATNWAVVVTASQVQREPLGRLQAYWGGSIRHYQPKSPPNRQPVYHWQLYGEKARGLAMTLYALMSPRRQGQISAQLEKWKTHGPGRHRVTPAHCPHGHAYTPENTYTYPDGRRGCRTCGNTASRLLQAKKRAYAKEVAEPIDVRIPKTHCPQGHEYTPENLYIHGSTRECRICRAASARAFTRKKAAAQGRMVQSKLPKNMKTHCPRGHEYTPENSRIDTLGYRACRACAREKAQERREAKRQKE